MQRSHIRFGTFERLHYLKRPDLIRTLLDHVVETYYPHLNPDPDRNTRFYAELVQRVAELAAQWMAAGFCHAVLNTDNLAITGESFDYGPFAFIDRYNPQFTAAYFDHFGRYCYANQPLICQWNLEMLQVPLQAAIAPDDLTAGLALFESHYTTAYRDRMMARLGFENLPVESADELLNLTIQLLQTTQIGYHDFFFTLRQQFSPQWREDADTIFADAVSPNADALVSCFKLWRQGYHRVLNELPQTELEQIAQRLNRNNPSIVIVRPEIEAVWEPITTDNNWEPFYDLLKRIQESVVLTPN